MTAPRILIGICSCHPNIELQRAIRDTWLRRLPTNMKAQFFVGHGASPRHGSVVQLEVKDGYCDLPVKVHRFFQHALKTQPFDYLFKCDDDTYLVPERFSRIVGISEFVGSTHLAHHDVASGGAGYLLSRRAVEFVAKETPPPTGAEDVWVSRCLKKGGFRLKSSPLLTWNFRRLPRPDNDIITAHWCSDEVLRRIDRSFSSMELRDTTALQFRATHRAWKGDINCYPDGFFTGGAAKPNGWWSYSSETDQFILHWSSWPEDVLDRVLDGFENSALRLEWLNKGVVALQPHSEDRLQGSLLLGDGFPARWHEVQAEALQNTPGWKVDDESGVITAADEKYFPGVQLLFAGLKGHARLALIDAGLSEMQRRWCENEQIQLILPNVAIPRSIPMWQTWNKPLFMQQSPFRTSLWIDSDCIVVGSLTPMFDQAKQKLFFVRHWSGANYEKPNSPRLFDFFPTAKQLPPEAKINAGVIGYSLPRDLKFLKSAERLLSRAAVDKTVRNLINWQDEGVFHWALAAHGRTDAILDKPGWNRLTKASGDRPMELFSNVITNAQPDDVILHFTGAKKIWHDWHLPDQML